MKNALVIAFLAALVVISLYSCGKNNIGCAEAQTVNEDFQFAGFYLYGTFKPIPNLPFEEKKYGNRNVVLYHSFVSKDDSLEIQYVDEADTNNIIMIIYEYTALSKNAFENARDRIFSLIGKGIIEKMRQYDLISNHNQTRYYTLQDKASLFKISLPLNDADSDYVLSLLLVDTVMIDKYE